MLSIQELTIDIQRGLYTHFDHVSGALEGARSPAAQQVFTRLYADAALAAATAADAVRAAGEGDRLGLLAGLAVSVKDLFDVAGETTLAGSVVCEGEAPAEADAVVVQRLRRAGAAIVGKTNMTEFAFSGVGINPHFGTPRNPADPTVARIPGGSSSGAAVSVALGLCVGAVGSDTGGSIRIPAALCGLVGFKSSQFRTPRTGAMELSRSLDTACALAPTVGDCLQLDAVLADAPLEVVERPLAGMRLAMPQAVVWDGAEEPVLRAVQRSLGALSAAGATLVDVPLVELAEIPVLNAPGGFSAVEAYAVHRERMARAKDRFDHRVAARIALGENVMAWEYLALHDNRRRWIQRVQQRLVGFDAFICPTVPLLAPPVDALLASDEAFFKANVLLLRNTFTVNYLDGCAFSLPCHAPDELPVGLMVASTCGADAQLASCALAIERVLNARRVA